MTCKSSCKLLMSSCLRALTWRRQDADQVAARLATMFPRNEGEVFSEPSYHSSTIMNGLLLLLLGFPHQRESQSSMIFDKDYATCFGVEGGWIIITHCRAMPMTSEIHPAVFLLKYVHQDMYICGSAKEHRGCHLVLPGRSISLPSAIQAF